MIAVLLASTLTATSTANAADAFKLRVRSADPARYYLQDAHRKSWAPDGALVYAQRSERHFIVRNGFEVGVDELTYTQEEAWLRLDGQLRDPKAKRLCGFAVWTPKGFDWV